jgi:hypothetical protein
MCIEVGLWFKVESDACFKRPSGFGAPRSVGAISQTQFINLILTFSLKRRRDTAYPLCSLRRGVSPRPTNPLLAWDGTYLIPDWTFYSLGGK